MLSSVVKQSSDEEMLNVVERLSVMRHLCLLDQLNIVGQLNAVPKLIFIVWTTEGFGAASSCETTKFYALAAYCEAAICSCSV